MAKEISRINGEIELGGRKFPFFLERQALELGAAGVVEHYYMPASGLRKNLTRDGINNVRSCLDHFAWLMELNGDGDDWDQKRELVLANSYTLICRDRAIQNIYRDAFLRPHSFRPETLELSEDVRQRIDAAIQQRSPSAIREEMETALEAATLAPEDRLASSRAMNVWLNLGTERFRELGPDGLQSWLDEVVHWYRTYRRRSTPRLQTFLRVFAYEAKVAFYHKYAQFWIAILSWLESNRDLQPMSKRFLSIWNNQNHRREIPHGRTASGIIYPTSGVSRLRVENLGQAHQQLQLAWKTPHIGAEVVPDAFLGQILALHPLGWILLARADLRDAVGGCIASPYFDEAMQSGRVAGFDEYWKMVHAIVTAAYYYQIAHDLNESSRPTRRTADVLRSSASNVVDRSLEGMLREFIHAQSERCTCGGQFELSSSDIPIPNGRQLVVPVICGECHRAVDLPTNQATLEAFFDLRPAPPKRSKSPKPSRG